MSRRMFLRRKWLLITVALAVTCWCYPAAAYQLTVTAWIDGYSQLIVQGNTVQWHNVSWTVPGWEEPPGSPPFPPEYPYPTTLSTPDMGTVDWQPTWTPGGLPIPTGDQYSDLFTQLNLPLAAVDDPLVGFSFTGRENAFISQYPLSGNGYTLIVDFDDVAPGGAAWYTAYINYTPGNNIAPLPGTAILLGSGLAFLVGLRRKLF